MERGVKVIRGDGKEVIFSDSAIRIVQDGGVTFEASEATWAIQDTYSLKPDMLRNTREAADVPEEAKVQFKEVFEKEIHERREHFLETVGFLNKEGL